MNAVKSNLQRLKMSETTTENKNIDPDNDFIIAILVTIINKTREKKGEECHPMIWRVKQLLKKTLKAVDKVGPFTLPKTAQTPTINDWENYHVS
jgi:hypothetical protein